MSDTPTIQLDEGWDKNIKKDALGPLEVRTLYVSENPYVTYWVCFRVGSVGGRHKQKERETVLECGVLQCLHV